MSGQVTLRRESWSRDGVEGITLVLDRPAQRNPLDHSTVRGLLEAVRAAAESRDVRAVVITGTGSAFSAGGDLRGYLDLYDDRPRFDAFLADFRDLCDMLERSDLVSCAMVNGTCVAGGLELALSCDLITMAQGARIGDGHLASGQLPGAGGSQRLLRAIGAQKAKELLLTGRLVEADEAAAMGLVNVVAPLDRLRDVTLDLVSSCGRHSRLGYGRMKELIHLARVTHLDAGLDAEMALVSDYATSSHDAREGLHAFLERRQPSYRGE